ncbi:elongation factor P maturation arginine rhamnosyltransferase EarP [Duganella sp. FT3S]|uniref:Protein-arginine rhamnosyltransferase n=2 Tax=Rugamonas fusca TaxID=2758568 RepID=A0A7W2EM19_9BURK|nr:elongation factor P maturation arginine rhamnosyltransferase EarP [Rugamonas fusca]
MAGPVSCLLAPHARAWADALPEVVDPAGHGRPTTLAIFCKVVDNYGDVGICWRMARQLAHEHGVAVELWVDDLHSFRRICPEVATDTEVQRVGGVTVRHWHSQHGEFEAADVADIVIEFFGCDIPEGYIAAMVGREPRSVWLNLEGLTAEEWVEGCHTLPSSHPRLPLTKHFFFPGFTAKTGGLLVESALDERRRQFQADPAAMADFLAQLGLSPAEIAAQKVSMFCYPHAPVAGLFTAWEQGAEPVTCLVPEGVAAEAVRAFLGAEPVAGAVASRGALTLRVLPFVPQPDYDKLLWACDVNFVRGEDSFVRAQWAGKPFIWHIYPQDENLHHKKLRAFLHRYAGGLDGLTAFSLYWNGAGTDDQHSAALWYALRAEMPAITARAAEWQRQILENGDMTGNLLKFSRVIQSVKHETRV